MDPRRQLDAGPLFVMQKKGKGWVAADNCCVEVATCRPVSHLNKQDRIWLEMLRADER
jgi:hypothetical protein